MYCNKCNTVIDTKAKFCYKCGAAMTQVEEISNVEKTKEAIPVVEIPLVEIGARPVKKKSTKKIIFVLLELLMIIAWGYLTYGIAKTGSMSLKTYGIVAGVTTLVMFSIYLVFLLRVRRIRKGAINYE